MDPARYYFRTNPLFEIGAKQYAWLNDIVCVGTGYLVQGGVGYRSRRLSEAISAIAGTEGAAAEALSRSAGRRLAAPGHQEERQPLVDAATGDDADGAFFHIP